jgi:hypothetical protein
MIRTLRNAAFSAVILAAGVAAHAQNDRFAYAITDLTKEGAGWNVLRKLDLSSGEYSNVLFNGIEARATVYDATTKKALVQVPDARYGTSLQLPFSTGVAAAAYDKKHNRLYYTPMFIDQLRYIDLKTMQVYYVSDQAFTGLGNLHNDEGKCVTRMVIAPDGNGYAITNDANNFIRFTTGKKAEITQLGALVDDPANKNISVHNHCTSFGGDMIADDKGNLYILSARNNVFKVSIDDKVAKHLGVIEGLPATFTTNGAAVDADGNLLVSSAVDATAWYVVNPNSWGASIYSSGGAFRASDLANSNFLQTGNRPKPTIETITRQGSDFSNLIKVFPNPVVSDQFSMQFDKVPSGDYTMELTDVMGRVVARKKITIKSETQVELISLKASNAKGVYLVKLADYNLKGVFEQKILVQ